LLNCPRFELIVISVLDTITDDNASTSSVSEISDLAIVTFWISPASIEADNAPSNPTSACEAEAKAESEAATSVESSFIEYPNAPAPYNPFSADLV